MSTTFANSIDNNPIYADRAEHDAAGNDLQTTYATKAELPEFSQAEQDAMDSGINSTKVSNYDNHLADTDIHVTTSDKSTWNGKQDAINDLSTIRSGAAAGATAVQPGDLATVAVSGDYADLLNKPTIPTVPVQDVTVDGTSVLNAQGVAEITMPTIPVNDVEVDGTSVVNASGVAEITMPTIPVTDVEVDGTSVLNAQGVAEITMPTIPVTDVEVGGSSVVNAQGVAEITMPTIPVTDVEVDGTSVVNNGVAEITMPAVPVQDVTVDGASVLNAQGVAEITMPTFTQAQADWTESDTTDPSYIQNKPTLAAVAVSGAYADLSGTPTINNVPAVTSSDDNKVLKASYSGGVGSYSWEAESGGTVTDVEVDGTSVVSGGVASITMPTELVPTVTSSDDGKVLKAAYSGGAGSYSWETESGGGGADWAAQSGEPGYIENKPVPKTLVAGTGITITENTAQLVVASTNQLYNAGNGLTLNNATFAVDTSVVATQNDLSGYATLNDIPTVDQTYDGTSANAQSGVAVASGISDAVAALPTNLTSAQIQALKEALGVDETVLYESAAGMQLHNGLQLPETLFNFERIRFYVTSCTLNGTPVSVEVPIQVTPYPNGTIELFFTNGHDVPSNYKLNWKWKMTLSGTTLTLTLAQYWGQSGTSWTQGDNPNDATVYKVVGIHRISNN